jgi:hypothetical protein
VLASKAFLKAVGARLTPSWAQQELTDLIKCAELGKDTLMLVDLGKVFSGLVANYAFRPKKTRVFAMLGARFNNKASARANTTNYEIACPYKRNNSNRKHYWPLEECSVLELAITGKTLREIKQKLIEEDI